MLNSLAATIRDAQQGDSAACEAIVREFSGLIQHECSKYGLRQHPDWSQSDLYQEAVIHVLSRISQFHGVDQPEPRPALEQWIRVATKNWLSNLERNRKAKKRFPDAELETLEYRDGKLGHDLKDPTKTASSIFSRQEEFERLHSAMCDFLNDEQREVLRLRVVDGMTIKGISEHLGLTYDQVRYRYEQSLDEMQRHLN